MRHAIVRIENQFSNRISKGKEMNPGKKSTITNYNSYSKMKQNQKQQKLSNNIIDKRTINYVKESN